MEAIILVTLVLIYCASTLGAMTLGYFVGRRSKIMGAFDGEC